MAEVIGFIGLGAMGKPIEAAAANGVAISSTALMAQFVSALVASGGADLDYSAVGTVLFKLAGT